MSRRQASLAAALFIPDHLHAPAHPAGMIHGIHLALRALAALTILSTFVFAELRSKVAMATR